MSIRSHRLPLNLKADKFLWVKWWIRMSRWEIANFSGFTMRIQSNKATHEILPKPHFYSCSWREHCLFFSAQLCKRDHRWTLIIASSLTLSSWITEQQTVSFFLHLRKFSHRPCIGPLVQRQSRLDIEMRGLHIHVKLVAQCRDAGSLMSSSIHRTASTSWRKREINLGRNRSWEYMHDYLDDDWVSLEYWHTETDLEGASIVRNFPVLKSSHSVSWTQRKSSIYLYKKEIFWTSEIGKNASTIRSDKAKAIAHRKSFEPSKDSPWQISDSKDNDQQII